MEAIVFIGLPGSGKSTFYKERFFNSHVRISLDLLKTRHREKRFLKLCLDTDQRFVIDNTNPTKKDRARFVKQIETAGIRYKLIAYYFESKVEACFRRNAQRSERVPDVAILATAKKLELPGNDEGFDERFYVRITEAGFMVKDWIDEV